MKKGLTEFSIKYPWIVISISLLITVFFAAQFPSIKIDTDPENMLKADEPARLFNKFAKDEFNLYDFIAVGVYRSPTAFSVDLLNRIYKVTTAIEDIDGVIADDIMAPSTVDDIQQGLDGSLLVERLMGEEINTPKQAEQIFDRIKKNPILRGKLSSEDGEVIAIFIPIESKDMSHRISLEIRSIIDSLGGDAEYHIAGLPLAEDSFGTEMFVQMALSAPVAMLIIFLLLFAFFKQMKIILAPMIVAMMSVIWAMGLLIFTGNTVHIMSSMIPIFLIPIAVLDSSHIISEFYDNHKRIGKIEETIRHCIGELYMPMLFTSLTTVVGFASLYLTPIPPVKIFGIFVAFGIVVAWFLSLMINPAIAMLISAKTLDNFGMKSDSISAMGRLMHFLHKLTGKHYIKIIVISALVIIIAGYGLTKIVVNDNPVKWFKSSHPIRIADKIMNQHLAGTYMNYLIFEGEDDDIMKEPVVQRYLERLQKDISANKTVGSTTGLPDIVKKIRYELFGADSTKMVIPKTKEEISQLLFLFEMSGGDPDDLFKFVTPQYDKTNIWVQLKNGDNLAVSSVVDRASDYMEKNPLPEGITAKWAGLPYINIEWQNQMVTGMGKSLLSSYLVVFVMMVILFRSIKWGVLSLLPLTVTIMAIYAFIGFVGKPYDMPVAVLSSLALGLSIDFAIHFIERFRMIYAHTGNFNEAFDEIFQSSGRAIGRNVMIIAFGFIPMLFATLVPYITVGIFFLAIMIISGLVTMLLLPSILKMFPNGLLKAENVNSNE